MSTNRNRKRTIQRHAHVMVVRVAMALAQELYESVMGDNALRAKWKRQNPGASEALLVKRFVARNTGKCLDAARTSLTLLLRSDTISDAHKDEIVDALAKDSYLLRGRTDEGLAKAALDGRLMGLGSIKGLPT